jgi:signal transduction histidine kinase
MGRIHADAQRLKKLVEHLLDLIGPRDGGAAVWAASPPTRLAVAPLLTAVRRSFSLLAAPRGMRLVVIAPEGLPDALVQGDRVTLAVANLVLNALAASPDGGTVTVRASFEPPRPPTGSSDAWNAPHGHVRFEVTDEGPGIPPARRMLALEEPPGLGLKVVREIVRRHGGALRIDEAQSGGALVAFTIPAARRRR